MYQPNHPSTQGYTSPPSLDPYRASPIPQPGPGQSYQAFTSPVSPPPPNAFSPMSSGHSSRFQQPYAPSPPHTGHYPRQSRYGAQPGYGQPQQQSQRPQGGPPGPGGPGGGGPQRYKGTLAPGTMVQVEEHQVRVEKYLSEGGYAHVYLTTSEKAISPPKKGNKWEKGFTQHCLKRIAFEDDSVWTDVKKEIEVMKALPPNPHLVQYLGSSHTRTSKGGHEVFILMEFCAGGGIIDLLNKRLRDRLKEAEILNIFTDVCEAVAAMHALKTPLLHRDLKIENVLSTPSPDQHSRSMGLIFKLCDFGSTTFPATHPPSTKVEADAQAMDLNKHTTLQYRSPEMVEPMMGLAVGLPSDVWALGVLLYKLCYYTTPFEEHGTLAIVNAKYTFPQYPVYSPRIQHLIASMLMEQPSRRPTVFDILKVSHDMSGTRPEIDYPDSLSKQLPPQPRNPAQSSSQRPSSSSSNLLHFSSSTSPPTQPSSSLQSNIQPQRRGRPARETINAKLPPMPTPPSVPSPAPTIVPSRLQLQVTGDRSSVKSPSPAASLDAFGLPAAPRPQGSTSSGFSDSFGSTQKQFRPTSRFGRGLSGTSGFGDSFDSSAPSSKAAPDVDRIAAANLEIPQTTSPIASSRQASTSTIQDDNFESRYPSIETLSSGDTSTPMARSNLISPITSPPPIVSRPSMLGNMTGGDLKQPHQHLAVQTGGPQPRSTHVTGTAFKQTFASSPSPIKSRTEYFEIQSQSQSTNAHGNEKAKQVDLMTGEDNEQMGAPLIRRASSTFHHSPSEHTKEDIRTRPEITTDDLQDSSDEEPGPESATYAPIRDPSPRPIENKTTENTRSNTLPPKDEMPSSTDRRSPSGSSQKQRPQTMYGYPSTSPQKTSSGLPIQQARPGHVRKGSINDMVTKFEGMNPPTNSNNGDKPIPEPKPKPSISSKPAQLKKPTLHTVRAEGLQQPILPTSATGARGSIPPKPLKPHGLGSMTSSGTHAAGARQGHGEAPKPDGYSRNSSGRSFPIVKPKPAFPSQAQVVTTPTPTSPSANNGSRSSSPDKQQSVNALVARWNQGEMSRKPAVKPKPVL